MPAPVSDKLVAILRGLPSQPAPINTYDELRSQADRDAQEILATSPLGLALLPAAEYERVMLRLRRTLVQAWARGFAAGRSAESRAHLAASLPVPRS